MHVYIAYTHIYIANTWTWWCFETFSNIRIYQNIWFRYTHIYVYMHTHIHIHMHMHKLIMIWLNRTTLGEELQHIKHLMFKFNPQSFEQALFCFQNPKNNTENSFLVVAAQNTQKRISKNKLMLACLRALGLSNTQSALYECLRVHGYVYKAKTYLTKDYSMYMNVCICIHICMYT